MPRIAADIVDAYVVRKINARVQFLLLMRRPDLPMGSTWQSIHERIEPGESALAAAERGITLRTGLVPTEAYSADFINQAYDHTRDVVVLAPVLAFAVPARSHVLLSDEYADHAWCERDEATARLLLSGQRWAVRHIDEIIGLDGPDAEFYQIR